jgi:signal transduction histidine kinase
MSGKMNKDSGVPDARLAAEVAHDLNNIFGAISGYAQFIAEDAPSGSPQIDHARKILMAAEQGAALAKRLGLGANGKG